nr:DNA-processing protein DprA [Leptolyngbya sp. BC1307]
MSSERAYWLAWSRLKDVGPVTIKRLWEHFGSLAIAWQASAGELLAVDGIGLLSAEKITALRLKLNPDSLLAQHEAANQSFWTPADADYPALLFAINDPPPVLYYRGQLRVNSLDTLTVGIVGTRSPSPYGKRWTQRLSHKLTVQGGVIVSGLAAGIDTEAHQSCLKLKGLTIAVLGTGTDIVYPHRNRELYEQIVATGLVVSEYPDGTPPDKTHFPRRNRIIAGLSRALLVTEAPARSGALITARLANDYCREVYALPCALDNRQGEGCLHLINQGAQIILGEQILIEALAALPPIAVELSEQSGEIDSRTEVTLTDSSTDSQAQPNAPERALLPELSSLLCQVLEAVPIEPVVLDQIVPLARVTTSELLSALLQLELLGLVTQLPGMQYQRS